MASHTRGTSRPHRPGLLRYIILGLTLFVTLSLAILNTVGALPAGLAPAPVSDLVLLPVADGYVDAERPDERFGRSTILRTYTMQQRSFLAFDVVVPPGATVMRAVLRVFANGHSTDGFAVFRTDETAWDEASLTHASAPA